MIAVQIGNQTGELAQRAETALVEALGGTVYFAPNGRKYAVYLEKLNVAVAKDAVAFPLDRVPRDWQSAVSV